MTTAHCPGRAHLVLVTQTHRVTLLRDVEMDCEEPLDPRRPFPTPPPEQQVEPASGLWIAAVTVAAALGSFATLIVLAPKAAAALCAVLLLAWR